MDAFVCLNLKVHFVHVFPIISELFLTFKDIIFVVKSWLQFETRFVTGGGRLQAIGLESGGAVASQAELMFHLKLFLIIIFK